MSFRKSFQWKFPSVFLSPEVWIKCDFMFLHPETVGGLCSERGAASGADLWQVLSGHIHGHGRLAPLSSPSPGPRQWPSDATPGARAGSWFQGWAVRAGDRSGERTAQSSASPSQRVAASQTNQKTEGRAEAPAALGLHFPT